MLQSILKPELKDSDAYRTIVEIIESRGFICEEHRIETFDGYFLTVHRVVNPLLGVGEARHRPVLLQHGFTSNSAHWLIASPDGHLIKEEDLDKDVVADIGPEKTTSNLGFALSKHGFDVWLGNFRGNRYSLEHKSLNSKDSAFWDFSLDEFIEFDLPATIDYILCETEQSSLGYIGHSQGSLTMFGLLSSHPEFNRKVKPFIALAPVARLNNMKTPVKHLIPIFYALTNNVTGQCINTEVIKPLISGHIFESYLQKIYHNFLFLLSGFNWDQVDESRLNVYHSHPFGDFSFKNLSHFMQIYKSGALVKFDHGKEMNLKNYGQEKPPEYDLKRISCPHICLFHGSNDWFTAEEDLDFLRNELTVPILEDYRVPCDSWNHLDFIWGKDCGKFVNQKIISILGSLNESPPSDLLLVKSL